MPKASKRAGKPRPTLLAKGINSLSHAQVRRSIDAGPPDDAALVL